MSFRKEKKYRLTYSDMLTLKAKLKGHGMTPLYPARFISSCYFDTHDLRLYEESEEGVLPRKKIRVRWYNKNNSFTKEVKVSSIEGRFKYTERLSSLSSFSELNDMTFFDQVYGSLKPAIVVSYEREYYSLGTLRVTFDSQIKYTDCRLQTLPSYRDDECVMEVKVPIDCEDDYIESIISHSTARFSKYSRGLLFSDGSM